MNQSQLWRTFVGSTLFFSFQCFGITFTCKDLPTGDNYFIQISSSKPRSARVWVENPATEKYVKFKEAFSIDTYQVGEKGSPETVLFFYRTSDDLSFSLSSAPTEPIRVTTIQGSHANKDKYYDSCYIFSL